MTEHNAEAAPNKFLEMERKREEGIFAEGSLYPMLRIGPYRIALVNDIWAVMEDGVEYPEGTLYPTLQAAVDYCIRADSLYTLTISGDLAGYYDDENGEGTWDALDREYRQGIARSVERALDGYMEGREVAFDWGIAQAE